MNKKAEPCGENHLQEEKFRLSCGNFGYNPNFRHGGRLVEEEDELTQQVRLPLTVKSLLPIMSRNNIFVGRYLEEGITSATVEGEFRERGFIRTKRRNLTLTGFKYTLCLDGQLLSNLKELPKGFHAHDCAICRRGSAAIEEPDCPKPRQNESHRQPP
jgi:hypothetical protein